MDRSDCYPVSDTVLSPIGERRESELRTMEQLMKFDSLARTESQKSDAEGPRFKVFVRVLVDLVVLTIKNMTIKNRLKISDKLNDRVKWI